MSEQDFQAPAKSFDLLIGSDVIYSPIATFVLAQSISYFLSDNGTALIANNVVRFNNFEEKFVADLKTYGLKVTQTIILPDKLTSHKLLVIQQIIN